jgi:sentrin-specific protease 1
MFDLSGNLARAWDWWAGLFKGIFGPAPAYSNMTYETVNGKYQRVLNAFTD